MKKTVLLLSFISLFFSCNNEENIEVGVATEKISKKEQIEKAPLKEQIAYAYEHLLDAGKIISKLYQDDKIKSEIISIIKSKYDKGMESEVFIKDLLEKGIFDKALSKENREKLDNSLAAFYDLDNQDWHVKIYIPFFEKQIKKEKTMQTDRTYDTSKPLVVIEVEDIPDPIGYQESDTTGELEALQEGITEDIALDVVNNGHDLIVIAIGDDYDDVINPIDDPIGDIDGGGSTGSSGNTPNYLYLKIDKMKVKYHKEHWSGGASEINIRGFWDDLSTGIYAQYGQFYTFHNDDYYGTRIKKFKRRWIRHGTTKTLNFKVMWDWNNLYSLNISSFYDYVIFECDSWPAPFRNATIDDLPNGLVRSIEYRSYQSRYKKDAVVLSDSHSLYNNYPDARNYQVDKNSIKFNFKQSY